MALAVAYGVGRAVGHPVVALGTLAAIHGPLNAFGFGLAGLLAWRRVTSAPRSCTEE